MALPAPKEIVDSIGDGACEGVSIGPRVIDKLGSNASEYGKNVTNDLANLRNGMPDRPMVIPETALKVAGHTVEGFVGVFTGLAGAVHETASGVKTQVNRVVR